LTFLSVSLQVHYRNFKFKAALESYIYESSFDSEVRLRGLLRSLANFGIGALARQLPYFVAMAEFITDPKMRHGTALQKGTARNGAFW
jgi:hypothetical protein